MWSPAPRQAADLQQVAKVLSEGDDWLIVTHERPDGDALGSAFAVAQMLSTLGKSWRLLVAEPMPRRFSYLPGFARAKVAQAQADRQFTHIVAVDCADRGRFDALNAYVAKDARIVNIDHHQTNPRYGVANYVDPLAAATCELLYHVARQLGLPLTVELATCLYTGLLTDTGGFSLPNTTREVHEIAAVLLASGVQPYDIAEPALESRTWPQMCLLKAALAHLRVLHQGRLATLYVTRKMLAEAGANDDDAEGLVGFARSVDTVEVGLLFRETADGRVKVSLRSKRRVDVAAIAQQFGGGGHIRAAGCTLDGPLAEAMERVTESVIHALGEE
ncbi:MAG: bifunctional oligoribonuclease/PAP phosphatase NrnA [Alicyclobacillus herbarius]|uniref:DHH family phosphoesterase n=1 Tax=Alicyclobacillus herbarius TaxID=122960 RepID=UPI00041A4703|nr:bifunctional oligoribonuclease/PAP phosphatase NrnA [Alicyclobacillus herbarius]MCL6632018.1 bifunctional oligoribonuclease/PAP phosphatase NrnA [Alicyclobacillus herbarius]